MNLADCKAEFRVEKSDLPRLTYSRSILLQTERHLGWYGGTVCAAETNKLRLQIQRYDSTLPRPVSVLRLIRNEVMDFIHDNHAIS